MWYLCCCVFVGIDGSLCLVLLFGGWFSVNVFVRFCLWLLCLFVLLMFVVLVVVVRVSVLLCVYLCFCV